MKALIAMLATLMAGPAAADTFEDFVHPPAETRPMVRWWWFGPKVEDAELVREIKAMKAGGFGGFEIQPVYPLELDGNTTYLSDDFLSSLRLANDTGRAEGMRVDLTLGSGWPFGGPHITADLASSRLRLLNLDPGSALPALAPGERIIAVFAGPDMATAALLDETPPTDARLFVVLQSPTGQQVKRPAVGAEGHVLDHMNAAAVQTHLTKVGEPLLTAFGDHPPHAIFSDSLEVYNADWTGDVLPEFRNRRGYDLKPHLLELFAETRTSAAVRHDWGLTLSELTEERYLTPLRVWAEKHNTKFRSQTYGFPPVTLSSNRLVDLAEGEGAHWRQFTSTRWASSANHLYGNPVTSAESWTWLHAGAFQATPLDIKAEADALMLQGVNQFIAHGWPYSPPSAEEPGWAFYAAAVFNDHNPWWTVMPDVNLYLQRMSWLLRQGDPVADVAIYIPTEDAFAGITPGKATVNAQMDAYIIPELTAQILDAGFNFDYVDGGSIAAKGINYKVLILPRVTRIEPETYRRIEAYRQAGGIVIAVDRLPETAPGLLNPDSATVRAISAKLSVTTEATLGQTLINQTTPDLSGLQPGIGFVHRKLPQGDAYFVANTTNAAVTLPLVFRDGQGPAQVWDARLGTAQAWDGTPVTLAPYESQVFVFGADALSAITKPKPQRRDLTGWQINSLPINTFPSWPDEHFSGVAIYSAKLEVSEADLKAGLTVLDFGEGEALPPVKQAAGMRADFSAPVRDAAEVYVNGVRAGAVWTAPFTINLKDYLKPGTNRLEIRVANTAVNLLSSRPPTDYAALKARYGDRFQPQGMGNLKPLPSGILKAPTLTTP
ncbi:hypothetical protein ABAC460_01200 [Asticcacaulis sp. AC460]|uniref:glycosyl hydrolase n=1 Tax=Asticcacaulis sp. AC460 TaxID=1282360 RepID=UPI0003C3E7E6|nr:glycosyl hydrolase [Asticcacaulis sp. AC460]ESQ93351.1 hypothetical protein ABAC460_01200 [Asticcacaulis sp. AC460]